MSLRELRHALKLTQENLAKALNIGQDGISRLEQRSDLLGDAERVVQGELTLAIEAGAERPSLDKRHDEIETAAGLAGVVEREDVRMAESGDGRDLAQEPLRFD